jgi:hypothetical protein
VIIFARTRHRYPSYTDFWKLVELSEFPVCFVDQIDLSREAVYITAPMNSETRTHLDAEKVRVGAGKRAKIIWWNLERPDLGQGYRPLRDLVQESTGLALDVVDQVWVSDRHFASLDSRLQFVVLGSHRGLASAPRGRREFDFSHMSHPTSRRTRILQELQDLCVGRNGWGMDRARVLARSGAMLNVHQTEAKVSEPLRFALAAAYGLPLLSEVMADPWPLVPGEDVLMEDYAELPVMVRHWLSDRRLSKVGTCLERKLLEVHPFAKGVRTGLLGTSDG